MTTFEAWAPTGQTCDAVVSGQTWHWVDPVAGAAKRPSRSHRVAGWPRFWNVDQPPPELPVSCFSTLSSERSTAG